MGFLTILESIAIFFSRVSSQPWDWTQVSCLSCIAGGFFTDESSAKPLLLSIWSPKYHFHFNSTKDEQYISFNYFAVCAYAVCVQSCLSCVRLCATLWTADCQALLSVWFSRQEYWSGLPGPPPKNQIRVSCFSCIGSRSFTTSITWEAHSVVYPSLNNSLLYTIIQIYTPNKLGK